MPVPPNSPSSVSPTPTPHPLTIGAVLATLVPDFPDITISKIRFLESEGLLTPQRTGSGYRTFSAGDVERLRYILTAQRDRFWPLKVIREALDKLERGLEPVPGDGAHQDHQVLRVPARAGDPNLPTAQDLGRPGDLRLTGQELCEAAGLDQPTFEALSTYGLLRAGPSGYYGEATLAVARAAGALSAYGIEPRHLRPFRTAADREIALVQQVVTPVRSRRRGREDEAPTDPAPGILAECIALHAALVKAELAVE